MRWRRFPRQWRGGDYEAQPRRIAAANAYFGIAANGGNSSCKRPRQPARPRPPGERTPRGPFGQDANDFLYQWEASRNYDPSSALDRVRAPVLAINSADDERCPPETGILPRALGRSRDARLHLIPASEETSATGRRQTRSSGSANSKRSC